MSDMITRSPDDSVVLVGDLRMCRDRKMLYIVIKVWDEECRMAFSWLHMLSVVGYEFRDPDGDCEDALIARGFLQ